ncbi:hypothetical protein ACFE04_025150 [Oxalis oulophora]
MASSGNNNFLQVIVKNFDVLALPVVTLVYPLYASIKAIETKSRVDDQQWLTYWVLYSMITLFELTFAKALEVLPFWPYAKLFFSCWLVLPQFNGAAHVYRRFIRPFYMDPQNYVNRQAATTMMYFPRKKNIFSQPDDVLTAAEKYIEEHGPEAFERMIAKSGREDRGSRRNTSYGNNKANNNYKMSNYNNNFHIFDDDYIY